METLSTYPLLCFSVMSVNFTCITVDCMRLRPPFCCVLIGSGLQRGTSSTPAGVRGERDPAVVGREAGGQTRVASQSHPADFAPKCPGCRTSVQVVGAPVQSLAGGDPLKHAGGEPD